MTTNPAKPTKDQMDARAKCQEAFEVLDSTSPSPNWRQLIKQLNDGGHDNPYEVLAQEIAVRLYSRNTKTATALWHLASHVGSFMELAVRDSENKAAIHARDAVLARFVNHQPAKRPAGLRVVQTVLRVQWSLPAIKSEAIPGRAGAKLHGLDGGTVDRFGRLLRDPLTLNEEAMLDTPATGAPPDGVP